MAEERSYHTGIARGEVGGYVLIPGDPGRTSLIARHFADARQVADRRGYRTYTGLLGGVPVSASSSGIGGPSAAIAVEELAGLGVHTFLRVGTCGAGQPGIHIGDLVIATGAVRGEATPNAYVPLEYPAIADHGMVAALQESAAAEGAPAHTGVIRSVDALYADLSPDAMPLGPRLRAEHETWRRAGVLANDMESATVLVVAGLKKLRAGSLLLCVDELEAGDIPPVDQSAMDRMLRVAVGAIARLIERDASRR